VVHSSADDVGAADEEEAPSGATITNANLEYYDEDDEDALGTLPDRAPLVVNGVTIVGRTGDTRPSPMVQGRNIHDPFSAIARELLGPVADRGGLLCFDELQVNDPFNAVAIKEIFMRLLELGVVVVTTSNRELDSLNRWTSTSRDSTFAPLVEAMAARCQQANLDGDVDYRRAEDARPETAESGFLVGEGEQMRESLDKILVSLREEIGASVRADRGQMKRRDGVDGQVRDLQYPHSSYSFPPHLILSPPHLIPPPPQDPNFKSSTEHEGDEEYFKSSTEHEGDEEYFKGAQISVLFGRMLTVPEGCWRGPGGNSRGVARFSFETLCGSALGSSDYAGIAAHFSVVMLDDVPKMNFNTRAQARRFITLVDELYNRRVRLVCSAAADIDSLFDGVVGLDLSHDMEQMAFETESAENKSRFDLTTTASVAATNRSIQDYSGEDEQFAFSRAASRLHEMQTPQYYVLQHASGASNGGFGSDNGRGFEGIDPKLSLAASGAQQLRSSQAPE
jgi:predicted ATPase